MYWLDTWYFRQSIEYEYKFAGRYGAKGEKREKRKKATPEQIKLQNQINRTNRVRRLIKKNFREFDHWCTLKYPRGTRKGIKSIKADIKKFLDKTRRAYKKRGKEFKFIYRAEIGKRGGPHIHILINRITDSDLIIPKAWESGTVDFTPAYEAGGFQKLAEYITKPVSGHDEKEETKAYSCSRNLVRPEPERKIYFRRTVERMIRDGIKPKPGYYIDQDSVQYGKNRFTGMSYLRYTEVRLERGRKKHADDPCIPAYHSPFP